MGKESNIGPKPSGYDPEIDTTEGFLQFSTLEPGPQLRQMREYLELSRRPLEERRAEREKEWQSTLAALTYLQELALMRKTYREMEEPSLGLPMEVIQEGRRLWAQMQDKRVTDEKIKRGLSLLLPEATMPEVLVRPQPVISAAEREVRLAKLPASVPKEIIEAIWFTLESGDISKEDWAKKIYKDEIGEGEGKISLKAAVHRMDAAMPRAKAILRFLNLRLQPVKKEKGEGVRENRYKLFTLEQLAKEEAQKETQQHPQKIKTPRAKKKTAIPSEEGEKREPEGQDLTGFSGTISDTNDSSNPPHEAVE